MLKEFQPQGFDVFAGSEVFLLQTLRNGGVGCITATGNVNATAIARLAASWQDKDADEQQAALNAVRNIFQKIPMIPAMKSAIAWQEIGRAHVCTPVTNAHLVCSLLLDTKK